MITPYSSPDGTVGCGLNTSKLLADIITQRPLPLLIPETIVYGYGFEVPTLIFTDNKGYVQILPRLQQSNFQTLTDIFSELRIINPSIIAPLALIKAPLSQYNKILMRNNELNLEWKNIHKSDIVIQRYILPKGTKCSKLRAKLKDNEIKIFKITNKNTFDRSNYEKNSDSLIRLNLTSGKISPQPESIKIPNNTDHRRSRIDFYRNSSSPIKVSNSIMLSPVKEVKYDNITEFMKSIYLNSSKSDISVLYQKLLKNNSRTADERETITEDIINGKITSKLRSMFCTESKNSSLSTIVELKSPKNTQGILKIFNMLKDHINTNILQPQNLKLTEIMCDFIEDYNKNIYFLQVKFAKFIQNVYVPLKSIKLFKKFSCPGDYCSGYSNQNDLIEQIIALPKKKVLPKKCKILLGTILGEKLDPNDSLQQLNPRLFERVRVCANCFLVYNEKYEKKVDQNVRRKTLVLENDLEENETRPVKNVSNKIKINKEYSYMGELGMKLHKINREALYKSVQNIRKKSITKKYFTPFDHKKKSIDKAIHLEEFLNINEAT